MLVPVDEAPADPPVERVLPFLVELAAVAAEPVDHPGSHRRLLTQPYGRAQHEDVARAEPLVDPRPVVAVPAVLGHVRPHAGGAVVVEGTKPLHAAAFASHDLHRGFGDTISVRLPR